MRILHCCLSCFYIDDYNYQENALPLINKLDGHEVKIITSTETFVGNSKLGYVAPRKYFSRDGIEINRVQYKRYLPHLIMKKIRHYDDVYNLVNEFSPDVILFHGMAAYELLTIARYKKNNPNVEFYVDSHEDKNNSATNWLSKNLLHKLFYKYIIKKAYAYIDKIFYISYETKMFIMDIYGINGNKMEFYPLGGFVFDEEERKKIRRKIRSKYNLKDDDILLVHSGKLDKSKRTSELLGALSEVKSNKIKLFIIGNLPESQKVVLEEFINKDTRVKFLGWKKTNELLEYLCACDLYIQPGSQSATMQNAACCMCALALYPYPSHKYLLKESAFYIENRYDMIALFKNISDNPNIIEQKRIMSYKIAMNLLDYKVLAKRLYNDPQKT